MVALLAAEGQQVSIVGELPAIDAFVEAVVNHDHQRLTACLPGGQIVPVRRDVDVVPWTLGYERHWYQRRPSTAAPAEKLTRVE
ncbi:MAG: hypothetical protein IPJ08_22015 [Burkholderiales bacterium]|nr:hypothetical protein [Burkholderiales bacterium]